MTEPSRSTSEELQGELRDLLCLAVVGDHVRWVLTGDDAPKLAQWLAESAAQWRAWADQIAQRLVSLGTAPDGRIRSLAVDIPLNWVPNGWLDVEEAQQLMAHRLDALAGWARLRCSQSVDPDSVPLIDAVCSGLEAQSQVLLALDER